MTDPPATAAGESLEPVATATALDRPAALVDVDITALYRRLEGALPRSPPRPG
jgi:hypothetical protein